MPRNFVWRIVDGFHVDAFTKNNPTNEEWEEMVAEFTPLARQMKGTLVYTEGGAPTAVQRKLLRVVHEQNGSTIPLTAIMTESFAARAAMTALNLFFDNRFQAFAPGSIEEALLYLKAPTPRWPALVQHLRELCLVLGLSLPKGGFSLGRSS